MFDRVGNLVSLEDFSKIININLIGIFNVCRLVVVSMVGNDLNDEFCGVIINIVLIVGYEG